MKLYTLRYMRPYSITATATADAIATVSNKQFCKSSGSDFYRRYKQFIANQRDVTYSKYTLDKYQTYNYTVKIYRYLL